MELMDLAKDFGPLVGIVLFFIWRDWRREQNLVDRVQKLEDFNTDVLTALVKEQAGVIATNTAVIATNTEIVKANTEQMRRIAEAR
jgi:CO dehydrogenase/acetyl-CoA synthase beta subunit